MIVLNGEFEPMGKRSKVVVMMLDFWEMLA